MPMPLWWGQVNKKIFNPRALKKGTWPVITHTGRSSGKIYRTPLEASAVKGGYIFIMVYGPQSDWVQNVLKAGAAKLEVAGATIELTSPEIISREDALPLLPESTKKPPNFLNVTGFLRMDTVA